MKTGVDSIHDTLCISSTLQRKDNIQRNTDTMNQPLSITVTE